MPVTTPVVPTVATERVALLQVPDAVTSERLDVAPIQAAAVPVMAAGNALTVTGYVTAAPHPVL